jgi:catechol 2,3-dioxygenase-like lactoylglutathione lyase family enzyme
MFPPGKVVGTTIRDGRGGMQSLRQMALVVRDYDEAIRFFVDTLGFELVEDTMLTEEKRWVVVRPRGGSGADLLLARAVSEEQATRIGNQTGGRVFLFLHTDDFDRDHAVLSAAGVRFVRPPAQEPWGKVAVFEDLYGNLWDLIEPAEPEPLRSPVDLPRPGGVRQLWPLLHVRDIERSIRFYVDSLGFELAGQAASNGQVFWCRLERGGATLMLERRPRGLELRSPPAPEVALYFVCDDVDAMAREFAERGVEMGPPTDAYYGMRQIFVPDPDGYAVCFESPTEGWSG